MREIKIFAWCDVASPDPKNPHREPATRTILLAPSDESKPRRLDVCEAHHADLKPWWDLLDAVGVDPATEASATRKPTPRPKSPAGTSSRAADPAECLVCGKSVRHIGDHLRDTHNIGIPEVLAALGKVDGDTYGCPRCAAVFMDTPAGVGRHYAMVHGGILVADTYRRAPEVIRAAHAALQHRGEAGNRVAVRSASSAAGSP